VAERGKEAGPAAADGTTTQWETYAASAIGADHRRDQSPNQDAVALKRFGPPGPDSLAVLAVADGHGDARHFRSDRGSKLAVTAAVAAAGRWAASIPAGAMPSRAAAGQLVSDLVARWRDAVHADLAEYPVGSGQAGAIREGDPPEIPYGTTLLLIAARADVAVLAQNCSHLGCSVSFNQDAKTFDCPCHGSRFHLDGTVLHGPAAYPLSNLDWKQGTDPKQIQVEGLTLGLVPMRKHLSAEVTRQ